MPARDLDTAAHRPYRAGVDLVYLHGPPAAGKLTIATELAALGVGEVFHNHLTMDAAVHPVFLDCSVAELERRVTDPVRAARRKLHSVDGLRTQLAAWNCVAVPRASCIRVATDGRTAADCAQEVVARLFGRDTDLGSTT